MTSHILLVLVTSPFIWFWSRNHYRRVWREDVLRCVESMTAPLLRQADPAGPLHLSQDVTGDMPPDLVFDVAKRAADRMKDTRRTSKLTVSRRWLDNRPGVQQWRASA